ncbi:hypothetical protein TIFTF001_048143 [Ficus carica]|uniref:Uncharacterized protein n=1 Tax=Ficus carica TaxID=3494 RepID=A0AA87ZS36_FICCA|nr:hypothetical protein TIFTF001_048143 [Ficus carica]
MTGSRRRDERDCNGMSVFSSPLSLAFCFWFFDGQQRDESGGDEIVRRMKRPDGDLP